MSEFDPPEDYFDRDDYGVIINGEGTYAELGKILFFDDPTPIFGWTDQEGTRLDIMMTWRAQQLTDLQRGVNAGTHLIVSVIGVGAGGFDVSNGQWKAPSYVAEKLGINPSNPIAEPLAELINGVVGELMK